MTDAQQREAARQFFYKWNGKGKEDEDARSYRASIKAANNEVAPVCPCCGATMIKRIVKSGPRQGKQIWGCPNYPKCKQIINID